MILLTTLALLAAAPDGGTIKIGSYSAMSGGSAPMGIAQHRGAVLAAEEINAAGGVLGKKLVIVDGDDEAKAEKGVQVVTGFLEEEKVAAIIGPANAASANATVQLSNRRQVPHVVCASAGALVNELFKQFPQNYVFRLAAGDAIQSAMMVTEAYAARGKRKPALIVDETPYGQGGKARVEKALADRGVAPAYVGVVKIGELDMAPHVKAARAAGADIVLLYTLGGEAAAVARALAQAAWKVPLIGTWTLSFPVFLKEPAGEGAIFPQTFIEEGAAEPSQLKFVEAFRKRWAAPHVEMGVAAAQAYDAVHLLALAFSQAGTTEGPKVKAALEDLKKPYYGATGEYVAPWRTDDHEAVTPANVMWGVSRAGAVAVDGGSGGGR